MDHIWCGLLQMRLPPTILASKQLGPPIKARGDAWGCAYLEDPGNHHIPDNGRFPEAELPFLQQELDVIIPWESGLLQLFST